MSFSPGPESGVLSQIVFLDSIEAAGLAESRVHYGIIEKTMKDEDPAQTLVRSIMSNLGSDTTLFESRLEPDQKTLLDRSLQFFLARSRKQDLLDHGLFQAASLVRAPEVFHALMDLGANPLRDMQSNVPNPSHRLGALVEALLHGSPGAAIAMMEKLTPDHAKQFVGQWIKEQNVERSLRETTTPSRGLLPKGMPDFLNLLEQKLDDSKRMNSIREEVVLQYLRCCYQTGHAWTPDVLASLGGQTLAPEGSSLEQRARKDAVEKRATGTEQGRQTWCEVLGQYALLTHCAPVLEAIKPMLQAHAKLPFEQRTELRIGTALQQKSMSKDFPFNAGNFQSALEVMMGQGYAFVVDYEQDGKAARYSALHDLAGHNGKNTYPHRMEKLLGLIESGAEPATRNLTGQLPASMVKPITDRNQWQGVLHARRARSAAFDLLKEMEGPSP